MKGGSFRSVRGGVLVPDTAESGNICTWKKSSGMTRTMVRTECFRVLISIVLVLSHHGQRHRMRQWDSIEARPNGIIRNNYDVRVHVHRSYFLAC